MTYKIILYPFSSVSYYVLSYSMHVIFYAFCWSCKFCNTKWLYFVMFDPCWHEKWIKQIRLNTFRCIKHIMMGVVTLNTFPFLISRRRFLSQKLNERPLPSLSYFADHSKFYNSNSDCWHEHLYFYLLLCGLYSGVTHFNIQTYEQSWQEL